VSLKNNALEFKAKIRKLRKVRPDISVSSDFIVGFPSETADDFQATMDLVHQIDFDNSFSFVYSPRPGTPAASLPDPTPIAEKKQRLSILQQRIALQTTKRSQAMLGTTQIILVTGASKKRSYEMSGRTECNRVVNFPGSEDLIGQFAHVNISDVLPNSLHGRLLNDA